MTCSSCGKDDLSGNAFCPACGAKLTTVCPKCGHEPAPDDAFCAKCCTKIAPADYAADTPVPNLENQFTQM